MNKDPTRVPNPQTLRNYDCHLLDSKLSFEKYPNHKKFISDIYSLVLLAVIYFNAQIKIIIANNPIKTIEDKIQLITKTTLSVPLSESCFFPASKSPDEFVVVCMVSCIEDNTVRCIDDGFFDLFVSS